MSIYFEYTGPESLTKYIVHRLNFIMDQRREAKYDWMVDFGKDYFSGALEGLLFAHLITEEQVQQLSLLTDRAAARTRVPLDLDLIHEKELTEMVNAILNPEPLTKEKLHAADLH